MSSPMNERLIRTLLAFGAKTGPIWPFAQGNGSSAQTYRTMVSRIMLTAVLALNIDRMNKIT